MSATSNNTTKLLSEIIQEISSLITVEEIVDKVYERVNTLMDATVFAIGVHMPETHQLCYVADMEKGQKLPVNYDALDDTSRLSVRCFITKKEIIINDIYQEYNVHFPGQTMPAPNAGEQPDAVIYVPLLIRSQAVGVLTVQSFEKNAYTQYHLDILRGLAVAIAGSLERARLYGNMEEEVYKRTLEVTQQKEEIETTYNNVKLLSHIGQQITSCLTVEKIIETTYENINRLMDASSFWIGIHSETEHRLNYPMGKEKGKNVGSAFYELTEDDRLPVWAFKNQKEVFVNDYLNDYKNYITGYEPAKPIAGEMPVSSIWLPLVSKEKKTFGIITIQSFEKDAYTEYHLSIVRNLAVFTSIALENALMYEQVEQKVKERTAEVVQQKEEIEVTYQNVKILSEIGQQITSCLSVEKILELTYENVNLLMDAPVFWIGIHNAAESRLDFPGAIEKGEKMPFFAIALNDDTRLATLCYNEKKNILINDLQKEFNQYLPKLTGPNVIIGDEPSSIIYLPLISAEKKRVGVISVQSFSKNAYTNYDIDILNSLAVFVNIALENALMYEKVEQKVIERTAQVVKQKEELEEKNKDITDSINYAKRIQEALLPSMEMRKKLFPEAFVLYQPRDIVSGDFYWYAEKNGKRLIAAVDCTGHGVPGAFMSMIGNSFLNEIVNERALTRPGLILDKLRNLVIRALKQSDAENGANDGMDISLLCLSETKSADGSIKIKADWSGANNPLWLMRNGNCIEYKADKRPISFSRGQEIPFTNHGIELEAGDTLYIFTDGFADQFGGEKGKKFKYKQLQQVLISIQHEPMQKQEQILADTFRKWKGSLEQVDDVLVIGVRV
jgi:serine phosphatase RsbU (regulator of sigma subunit)